MSEKRLCPDLGTCHHGCTKGCFRVAHCGPLPGVFVDDEWPEGVKFALGKDVVHDDPITAVIAGTRRPLVEKHAELEAKRDEHIEAAELYLDQDRGLMAANVHAQLAAVYQAQVDALERYFQAGGA